MDSRPVPRVNRTNFVALALVINRVRDGPTFVFHYPPQVRAVSTPDIMDESASMLCYGDMLLERLSGPGPLEGSMAGSRPNKAPTDNLSQCMPWDTVAGFPTQDLASILTPGRPYHKKLFQLSLDPLCCVSYPIHVPESGRWKRKKKPPRLEDSDTPNHDNERVDPKISSKKDEQINETCPRLEQNKGDIKLSQRESKTNQNNNGECGSKQDFRTPIHLNQSHGTPEAKHDKPSSMNMFNLVFILNPKKHEINELVEALYLNIVKKVNKALSYAQGHSDFVWKESKKILALKDNGRDEKRRINSLWKDIVAASSLASSMREIYDAVSHNKIATLQLEIQNGDALTPSVQIPIPFSVADIPLPGYDEPLNRGLWLTTANTFVSEDAVDEPSFLDRNFALLLMDDEKNILAELQAGVEQSTQSMVEFVGLSRPTTSFHKVGQNSSISLSQVRRFAQHFIFWRRAIAIPPLHARDIYILSSNCNLQQLPRAISQWQRNFPNSLPLNNILAELSSTPRPFKYFSPTKAHRPLYLQMLAWLMRGGWVTQLCTFAYVVVWPEIVYEVEYHLEAEELRKTASKPQTTVLSLSAAPSVLESLPPSPYKHHANYKHWDRPTTTEGTPNVPTMMEQAAEQARLDRIADKVRIEAAEKATAHARKVIPIVTEHPSLNLAPHLAGISPYIILDPRRAAGKESLYLSAIGRRFGDEKVATAWSRFLKYFNGKCAIERIALQNDIKRKEAWYLLGAMSEFLLYVRHW